MPRTKSAEEKPMKKALKKDTVEAKVATESRGKGAIVDVFDMKGNKTTMTLPEAVFGVKVNKSLLSQAIRVYLANQRVGSANTKTRGEVEGSTRKIYQQKGTGRARHGGVRAPIFVHGGVAHGPRLHDFSLSMPKKMRKRALFGALTVQREAGRMAVINGLENVEAKTKAVAAILKKIGMNGNVLIVLPQKGDKTENVIKAARNIQGVQLLPVTQLNTYEVLKASKMLFMHDAIEALQGEGKEK